MYTQRGKRLKHMSWEGGALAAVLVLIRTARSSSQVAASMTAAMLRTGATIGEHWGQPTALRRARLLPLRLLLCSAWSGLAYRDYDKRERRRDACTTTVHRLCTCVVAPPRIPRGPCSVTVSPGAAGGPLEVFLSGSVVSATKAVFLECMLWASRRVGCIVTLLSTGDVGAGGRQDTPVLYYPLLVVPVHADSMPAW